MTPGAINSGTRLGPYEILAPLGAGGMGEVYRALDTRLGRTVAVKLLGERAGETAEARARFEREARAIAALQHPHICVLHDVGMDGSQAYLVMEYLEGETLAGRLRRGPLPVAELLRLGSQIAGALERAHRAGIIHRDLKPANIMLTAAGAKLLDFGLAKPAAGRAASGAGSAPPSFTATLPPTLLESPVTQAGAVLGTVQYMSPEQIEGKEADARSDIFALGCVLYECATGARAFEGKSSLALAAAILEQEPARLDTRMPAIAPGLRHTIELCLRKAPDERWQAAGDVRAELDWVASGESAAALVTTAAAGAAPAGASWRWKAATGAAVLAAAVFAWLWARQPLPPSEVAEIAPPAGTRFAFGGEDPSAPAVSPDGGSLAFTAVGTDGHSWLWVRRLGEFQARKLAGTENAFWPQWSADGTAIAYFTTGGMVELAAQKSYLMAMDLGSGQTRQLGEAMVPRGMSWARDGTVLLTPNVTGPVMKIPPGGGTAVAATSLAGTPYTSQRFPDFLPDGKHFIYLAIEHDDESKDMLFLASMDGTVNRPLVHSITGGIYAQAGGRGYLLYSVAGTLLAQTMDATTGALSGTPQAIAQGVEDDPQSWRPAYSAGGGTLAYASGVQGQQQLAWIDRSGKTVAVLPSFKGQGLTAALAPGGGRLALSLDAGLQDIWIETVASGAMSQLTFGPTANLFPAWSPDGTWLAYSSVQAGQDVITRRRADGGGSEMQLPTPPGEENVAAWSPDGGRLLYERIASNFNYTLEEMGAGGAATPRVLAGPQANPIMEAAYSPDGRWISYLEGEAGTEMRLMVIPAAGGAGRWQVADPGVSAYYWVDGGKELLLVDDSGTLWSVGVSATGGAPGFGAPVVVTKNFPVSLAATADGERFLSGSYPRDVTRITVVTGYGRQ